MTKAVESYDRNHDFSFRGTYISKKNKKSCLLI